MTRLPTRERVANFTLHFKVLRQACRSNNASSSSSTSLQTFTHPPLSLTQWKATVQEPYLQFISFWCVSEINKCLPWRREYGTEEWAFSACTFGTPAGCECINLCTRRARHKSELFLEKYPRIRVGFFIHSSLIHFKAEDSIENTLLFFPSSEPTTVKFTLSHWRHEWRKKETPSPKDIKWWFQTFSCPSGKCIIKFYWVDCY